MESFVIVSGQLLLLLGAIPGAGGGFKFIAEPILKRNRLRRIMATGLWLSSYELRNHIEDIQKKLNEKNAEGLRNSLKKIPRYDYGMRLDWFVKDGYFCMITAYKIAAFSSWMRIYQKAVLQAALGMKQTAFITSLFQRFDVFKAAASERTVLWYSYIEAIGDKIITQEGDLSSPLSFGDYCKRYYDDADFRMFYDQLHMFVHFIGRTDEPWPCINDAAFKEMIAALASLEELLVREKEILFADVNLKLRSEIPTPRALEDLRAFSKEPEKT